MKKSTRPPRPRQVPDGLKRDKDGHIVAVQLEAFPTPVIPSRKAARAASLGQITLFPESPQ